MQNEHCKISNEKWKEINLKYELLSFHFICSLLTANFSLLIVN